VIAVKTLRIRLNQTSFHLVISSLTSGDALTGVVLLRLLTSLELTLIATVNPSAKVNRLIITVHQTGGLVIIRSILSHCRWSEFLRFDISASWASHFCGSVGIAEIFLQLVDYLVIGLGICIALSNKRDLLFLTVHDNSQIAEP